MIVATTGLFCDPIVRLTEIDLLSSRLSTSSFIRSRKCFRTQSMTKRLGANSFNVFNSCSTCSGRIQVLSCCSLISPSREDIHCCQIEFKVVSLLPYVIPLPEIPKRSPFPKDSSDKTRAKELIIKLGLLPVSPKLESIMYRSVTAHTILIHSLSKGRRHKNLREIPVSCLPSRQFACEMNDLNAHQTN